MNKQIKNLFIVVPSSFVLLGLAVAAFLLDPSFTASVYIILSMVICSVWAFFFAPALMFSLVWIKNYFSGLSFEQSFRFGYFLGRGWGVLAVVLFLAVSPITGTVWYVQTVTEIIYDSKQKRQKNLSSSDDCDVFDL